IGREIGYRLAEAGLNLVLVGRQRTLLEQMSTELANRHSIQVRIVELDLALESSIKTLEATTRDLDVGLLIGAAGFGTSGSFLNAQLEPEIEMLNVNCRALLELSWYFGRRFAERGRGGIVLMSSIVGFQGTPFAAHYAATKSYVQALGEALSVELAPLGVDVLTAAPGPTDSNFATRAGMKLGVALKPQDIAQPILAALGRRSTVLPGFLSKLLTYLLMPLPRWVRVRIMGGVMAGMTQHQRKTSDFAEDK
ncbi:MAG: SDR family NAD(P)-dependent oxidoreductase, partial [Leptolyngbyaceae cyanobacterium RM1_406_9]|nr:SDR family NAD(P)-dependent oxidoreductase [Leptolyngbyaceae cyanobacterium RM1_406_9]